MSDRRQGPLVPTPAVVGHRGASGYRPEHTIAAHRLAIAMGVDDIELDVVTTADGELIVRHENELGRSTDIASRAEFADRRTARVVDGREQQGWFSEDLTLAEIRRLRARERWPEQRAASAAQDGRFEVPTLAEILAMVGAESAARGRSVGAMIEIKHAAHFAARGLPVAGPLLAALREAGVDHPRSRVTLMSFESEILRLLAPRTGVPVLQLVDRAPSRMPDLAEVDEYADGVAFHHELVTADPSLVARAHRHWLPVHVWTLRAEPRHLPGIPLSRYAARLLDLGVDGLITDHPDVVLSARDSWLQVAGPRSAVAAALG